MFRKIVNRETVRYGIFGVLTSILNVVLFQLLILGEIDYRYANFITLIVVKVVAYLCNKNFVFYSRCRSMIELVKEFGRFVITRSVTMLIDYFGLILLVEFFNANKLFSKCFITIFVIVINYFLGKKHVFKNQRRM